MSEAAIPKTGIAVVRHREVEAAILARDARLLPGWRLFPVVGKEPPRGLPWKEAASAETDERAALAAEYGHDGWAVHCGRSGFLVVDLDEKNGVSGADTWCAILDAAGMPTGEGNPRVIGSTPSGGRHLYYRAPLDEPELLCPIVGFLPSIDIRSGNSYAVLSGPNRALTLIRDGSEPFPDAPKPLLDLLRAHARRASEYTVQNSEAFAPSSPDAAWRALEGACRTVASAPEGTRNALLNWAAYGAGRRALGSGWSVADVEAVLLLAARDCGLPFTEASRTVQSGLTARNEVR